MIGATAASLLCVFVWIGFRLFREVREENAYETENENLQRLRPQLPTGAGGTTEPAGGNEGTPSDPEPAEPVNYLAELQESNPDVAAWLTVPGTAIDFPVVQGGDNKYYLNHDLAGESSKLGVPFLDVRCRRDFTDFNSIVYGHHISGGRMFSELDKFREEAFFFEHPEATLITETHVYTVRLLACLITPSDGFVYHTVFLSEDDRRIFLRDVRANALWLRDFSEEELLSGSLLTLSTCAYEYEGARTVLIGALEEGSTKQGQP